MPTACLHSIQRTAHTRSQRKTHTHTLKCDINFLSLCKVHTRRGATTAADSIQVWASYLTINNRPDVRRVPTRFYHVRTRYCEMCNMSKSFQQLQEALTRKTRTHAIQKDFQPPRCHANHENTTVNPLTKGMQNSARNPLDWTQTHCIL